MRVEAQTLAGGLRLSVRCWDAEAEVGRPDAVLLPGTGETADTWDAVAADLSRDRTVLAVNLRGHGGSDRPGEYSIELMATDVVALLAARPAPVDLVGHSLGGLVAWLAAVRAPDRVRRLALEEVGLLQPRPPAMPARPPGELAFDWAVVEQVRPEIDTPHPDWPSRATALGCPTLVVGGGPTSHVPQEHVAALAEAAPDGRLVTIDAGHLVHTVEPERFVATVRDFLDA